MGLIFDALFLVLVITGNFALIPLLFVAIFLLDVVSNGKLTESIPDVSDSQ